MNTVVTSRQALLAASRTVARRQGLGGLSIRAVAAEARVSVGSVYNYFSGKTELLAATVEEIWMQILSAPEGEAPRDGFTAYVHWLFHRIQSGAGEYPGFFQGHAAGFLPEGGARAGEPWRRPSGASAVRTLLLFGGRSRADCCRAGAVAPVRGWSRCFLLPQAREPRLFRAGPAYTGLVWGRQASASCASGARTTVRALRWSCCSRAWCSSWFSGTQHTGGQPGAGWNPARQQKQCFFLPW